MKHPVRDRLLMLLYALASLCGAGALVAIAFERITLEMLSGVAAQACALPMKNVKLALLVGAVVLVVLGLSLISAMFPPKKKRSSSFAIQQNENGTVRISLKTIDALVQKCLNQHSELKVVSSALFSDEETVRVDVHIALLSDISMPLAISALQKQITRYVEACSGVNVREVRIFVDGAIANVEKAAQSKYALPASMLTEEIAFVPAEEEAEAEEAAQETAEEEVPVQVIAEQEEIPAETAEETAVETETAEETAEEVPVSEETPVQQEEAAERQENGEADTETAQEENEPAKKKLFGFFAKK